MNECLSFKVAPMNFRVLGFCRRIFTGWGFANDLSHFEVSPVNFGNMSNSLGFINKFLHLGFH